jgi:hypothetical protein
MNLRELVETVDVPPTRVAEEAWDRARQRVVRRRATAAGAAGIVVVVGLVGVGVSGSGGDRRPEPLRPSPTTSGEDADFPVTVPDWGELAVDTVPAPGPDAPDLSSDPVGSASLAVATDNTTAYVLGDDGAWRLVDVDGLQPVTDHGGNESPVVRPAGLSANGTMLALPQPDALVVVDLTKGTSQRYDVPGPANTYVIWQDSTHVLVVEENRLHGTLVDVATGSTSASDHSRATRVLPDGSALTWDWGTPMRWDDGREVTSRANNSGGFFPQPPLVSGDGDVVVGLHGVGRPMSDPGAYAADTLFNHNGVVAVDGDDGDILGFLQLGKGKGDASILLGWSGDLPVVGLATSVSAQQLRTHVVIWDYRAGTVEPLATLPSWWVSWGIGL